MSIGLVHPKFLMPPVLAKGEEEGIGKWRIGRMEIANDLEVIVPAVENDITLGDRCFAIGVADDDSDFISCRRVKAATVQSWG